MEAPVNTENAAVRQRKIRRRKMLSMALIAAVILAVVVIVLLERSKKTNTLGGVATATVGRATIVQKISATGNVTAQTGAQVNIGSQITGRVKNLYVDIGTHVNAGQVIAVLDLPDIKAQYDQSAAALKSAGLVLDQQVSGVGQQQTTVRTDINKAQAALASAQATYKQDSETANAQVQTAQSAINQAKANYQNAVTFLGREKQLLAKGYVAAQDVDNAQTQVDVAAAQLDSAQQALQLAQTRTATTVQTDQAVVQNAQAALASARAETAQNTIKGQQVAGARSAVQQAQANLAYWQDQYNKTIIRTPISGTVTTLSTQQGETVAAGLSAPTLVTVADLKRLQVEAFVDETDIGNVHVGQRATVTVDAYPNNQFIGHVVQIASSGILQQNVVTYDTTIALDSTQGLLKPAMTATVSIVVSEHRDVVAVPTAAVKYIGTNPVIYVVQGVKTTPKQIVTGASDDTNTEILKGVSPGETIVLAGYPPSGGPPRPGLFGPSAAPRAPSAGAPGGGAGRGPGGGAGRRGAGG